MKLYSYWRSTTSYRVRIALNLKNIAYEILPINLAADEQHSDAYAQKNPMKGVPSLMLEDGSVITQSIAIVRYIENIVPTPALLPKDSIHAAKIEATALIIATDIHPVNNLKVMQYLTKHGHTEKQARMWMNHWMREGLLAFHALLPKNQLFCFGNSPSLADVCLIPQLYNSHRWGTDLTGLDRLLAIEKNALELAAFDAARPENQPDAHKE